MSPPLDLDGLPRWLVQRGMRGLPLDDQIAGFCQRIFDSGFPMKRVQVGMSTLHPRYGSHTFVWRPGADGVTHTPRKHEVLSQGIYLNSPVHYMRSRGLLTFRQRLDSGNAEGFPVFAELRSEGLVDYAAHIVPYDPGEADDIARTTAAVDSPLGSRQINGIFFSCATDRSEGFDNGQLEQVVQALPYLALAIKSRLTYDVATTVLETYLGKDAGQRVLTGAIERGSAESIRAVIWFADLRGFTTLTDALPRDTLVATLDDYLEAMSAPVQASNGQILKFMGDGVLATFDLTGRDDASVCRDALAAAAALQSGFPSFNDTRAAEGKPTMEFGLALHLGDVFYGNIGASDRLDFTVIGPAVNEASRIQALCRPLDQHVLISKTFHETVGAAAELRSVGSHALRGVREPQELFALTT